MARGDGLRARATFPNSSDDKVTFREGLPRSMHNVMGLVHTGHSNDNYPLGDENGDNDGERGSNAATQLTTISTGASLDLERGPLELRRRAFRARVASLLARVSQEALAR